MAEFFRPYEGSKPVFFISYSHRNTQFVLDTITPLRQKALLLWYDEGIPAGSDWPKNIAQHMGMCDTVVFFRSKHSLASPNCLSEITTARENGKTVLCVPLDTAEPEPEMAADWEKALSTAHAYPLSQNAPSLAAALAADPLLTEKFSGTESDYAVRKNGRGKRRIWDLLLVILTLSVLFGGAALFAQRELASRTVPAFSASVRAAVPAPDLGQYTQFFKRSVEFPGRQVESAVRRAVGIPSEVISAEELTDIREMIFCGDRTAVSAQDISRSESGEWMLYGQAVGEGSITDLLFFRQLPYLETLVLVSQPITSLTTVSEHDEEGAAQLLASLQTLSLAGCSSLTLEGLGSMPSLQTLALEHSGVRDLTALSALPSLRTVTVSADMLPLKLDKNAAYDVILVK